MKAAAAAATAAATSAIGLSRALLTDMQHPTCASVPCLLTVQTAQPQTKDTAETEGAQ